MRMALSAGDKLSPHKSRNSSLSTLKIRHHGLEPASLFVLDGYLVAFPRGLTSGEKNLSRHSASATTSARCFPDPPRGAIPRSHSPCAGRTSDRPRPARPTIPGTAQSPFGHLPQPRNRVCFFRHRTSHFDHFPHEMLPRYCRIKIAERESSESDHPHHSLPQVVPD